jgi:hypothetical protein
MPTEIEALRADVAQLRQELAQAEDWANGIQMMLVQLLPLLLRDHPEAHAAADLLRSCDERYEELLRHPNRAEDEHEKAGLYEASKMMHRQLSLLQAKPGLEAFARPLRR